MNIMNKTILRASLIGVMSIASVSCAFPFHHNGWGHRGHHIEKSRDHGHRHDNEQRKHKHRQKEHRHEKYSQIDDERAMKIEMQRYVCGKCA